MGIVSGSGKILYCAIPTRMRDFGPQAKEIARLAGYSPVMPFDALTYEDSEGGPLSRERTLRFDLELMRCCDTLGIFGVSSGVMGEFRDALERGMDVRAFYGHDPEWEKQYETLTLKFGDMFSELRGPHSLVALVGPTAIGKTYWSERLLGVFDGRLAMVRNTTTRKPRNDKDLGLYNFVSREEFESGIAERRFLEHDEYLGNYYGSSMSAIREVLAGQNGVFAITPSGAVALHERRFEINLSIILLRPADDNVLVKNFLRRNITDPAEQARLIRESKKFRLPPDIGHKTITLTATAEDEFKIVSAVETILNRSL